MVFAAISCRIPCRSLPLPPPLDQTGKNPFDSYANLEAAGVEVKWTDLGAASTAEALGDSGPYEFVFDNW